METQLANSVDNTAKKFNAIKGEAKDAASDIRSRVQDSASMIRGELSNVLTTSQKAIKANPFYFIAGSAVAGLAIGFLLGARRK